MKRAELHRTIRKSHRYLGVTLGVQFLFWTLGGLYFSWSDLDDVHGDHQKAHIHPIRGNIQLAPLSDVLQKLKAKDSVNFIFDTHLVQILSEPIYQIIYSKEHDRGKKIQLANAVSGELRPALSRTEATQVAQSSFTDEAKVKSVEYLTTTNGHHEYRKEPLPAYAITFDHPSNTTVYVSTQLGTVQKFRNNKWRVFDVLWMLHTMDYQTRDHFGNWVLRAFSVLGLITVFSGFWLFWLSRKKKIIKPSPVSKH
ncbi:hypothetical protein P1X15_26670 [Runella sp. MFBS21]|jgi:uncharacterized iron-regulated membrane protein|uniref:hypothetical protein n=1 Tax=Runella sp. MFBS21 TaxID=3034018 RepID=UPI0023F81257|nr:hypothetical protein [Runella sp. MFBS21]MCA0233112.1 hypothetical protein [Bacteroidota bacterium]MDF7821236.1 hypothetical protein [Runella sp. MFBS21]